jgi:hypothetical protein
MCGGREGGRLVVVFVFVSSKVVDSVKITSILHGWAWEYIRNYAADAVVVVVVVALYVTRREIA